MLKTGHSNTPLYCELCANSPLAWLKPEKIGAIAAVHILGIHISTALEWTLVVRLA